MSELITIVFSSIIVSFIVTKYFSYSSLRENLKFKNKDYFIFSYIISFVSYIGVFMGLIARNKFVLVAFLCLLIGIVIKEVVASFVKINYYNKKFQIILKMDDYNINKGKIKNDMSKDALRNIFVILASPFLILEWLINSILSLVF